MLALCIFAGRLRAQRTTPSANVSGSDVISGVVVNSANGQPLEAADVTLTDTKTTALVAEVNSDAQGRFAFAHLADGKYSLRAVHRGFIPSAFDAHDGFSSAIVTGAGLVSTGLKFDLKPLAVIFGTIMDDSGDPVQTARVSLYRPDARGTGKMVRAGAVTSDDLGNYEFPRLSPGNYYMVVIAQPWYATHRQLSAPQLNDPSLQRPRSPLDVAYPPTYYADVTDAEAATPIPVKAGDRIPVNFTLHAVPAVSITMQFPGALRGGMLPGMPQFGQNIFGAMQPDAMRSVTYSSHDDGSGAPGMTTVEVSGIAPGHYDMELRSQRGEPSRFMSFDASADHQVVDASAGELLADISGKVTMTGGGKLPPGLNIALVPVQGEENSNVRVERDGSFEIHNVRPGTYEVVPRAPETAVATAQITATGATVDNRMLRVGSAPVTLIATLVESTATVSGFAKAGGKPAMGVMVVLVPKGAGASRELIRRDQSDSDGSFTLKRVIPGEYTVVAISDGWTLDWGRPEVITQYLPRGVKITVSAHSKDISLPAAVEVQPK